MIKRHVTVQELRAAVFACVEERGPDYQYEAPVDDSGLQGSCLYWHDRDDRPGCIVGLALYKLGADDEFLRNHEGNTSIGMLKLLKEDHEWTFEDYEGVNWWLNEIQRRQDDGMRWGSAVSATYEEGRIHD